MNDQPERGNVGMTILRVQSAADVRRFQQVLMRRGLMKGAYKQDGKVVRFDGWVRSVVFDEGTATWVVTIRDARRGVSGRYWTPAAERSLARRRTRPEPSA